MGNILTPISSNRSLIVQATSQITYNGPWKVMNPAECVMRPMTLPCYTHQPNTHAGGFDFMKPICFAAAAVRKSSHQGTNLGGFLKYGQIMLFSVHQIKVKQGLTALEFFLTTIRFLLLMERITNDSQSLRATSINI